MLLLLAQPGSLRAPLQQGGWGGGAGRGGRTNRESILDASLAPLTDMLRGLCCLNCLNRLMCCPGPLLKDVTNKTHLEQLTHSLTFV